jgi:ATP-dependent Clp protease protease subunit
MKKRLSKKEYAEAVANDGRFHPAMYSMIPTAHDGTRLEARVTDAAKKRGEIILYGTIGMDWFGEGITAKSFEKELKGLGKVNAIDLRINSEGGSVHDARAIYSLLIQHGAKVDVFVDSLAASAASFIAMAGDTITITESAFFMIHNARMFAAGGADDFRAAADFLDTVNRTIADTYTARTGQKADKIKKWMDAETWFTGQQALDEGFATAIVKNKTAEDAKAQITVDPVFNYANVPPVFRPNRAKAMALMQRGNYGTTAG